jgi:hypothetical protein
MLVVGVEILQAALLLPVALVAVRLVLLVTPVLNLLLHPLT